MRSGSCLRCGASAVELALVLPVLGLLFVFAVDFARLYFYYSIITNCARNGALWASDPTAALESPYGNATAAALADWPAHVSPTPTVTPPHPELSTPNVQVTVTWPFTTLLSYPGLPNPINLTRTVQMRKAPSAPN
jgi:Flp pilus assembly protein TadG